MVKTIAKTLEMSREYAEFIFREHLSMQKTVGQVDAEMFECQKEMKSDRHLHIDFAAFE